MSHVAFEYIILYDSRVMYDVSIILFLACAKAIDRVCQMANQPMIQLYPIGQRIKER